MRKKGSAKVEARSRKLENAKVEARFEDGKDESESPPYVVRLRLGCATRATWSRPGVGCVRIALQLCVRCVCTLVSLPPHWVRLRRLRTWCVRGLGARRMRLWPQPGVWLCEDCPPAIRAVRLRTETRSRSAESADLDAQSRKVESAEVEARIKDGKGEKESPPHGMR